MSRILIFGLSGQVGDALRPLLLESDYQITAVSRDEKNDEKNIAWQQASFENFSRGLEHFDIVVSLGPLDAFSNWMIASEIKPKKIIALSSTSIVTKKNSPDPAERKLAQMLLDGEQRLQVYAGENSSGLVILRPTLIYGVGRDQSLSRWLKMAARFKCVVLPTHAAGLRQPVHVADVAMAVFKSLSLKNPQPLILDLPGGEILPFDQMLLRSLKAQLPGTRVLRVPGLLFRSLLRTAAVFGLMHGLGPGFFARLAEDWVFDPAPVEKELGFRPRPFSL
ncbi:MAG: NAD-dependent epimerase/dehydratase family protein [Arenimonas sp.]